jgi:hypothetical protein
MLLFVVEVVGFEGGGFCRCGCEGLWEEVGFHVSKYNWNLGMGTINNTSFVWGDCEFNHIILAPVRIIFMALRESYMGSFFLEFLHSHTCRQKTFLQQSSVLHRG